MTKEKLTGLLAPVDRGERCFAIAVVLRLITCTGRRLEEVERGSN